jgi:hypothetical protein
MCDYSLAHVPNRLAVEGEQLVVHRFGTGARGLAPAHQSWKQQLFAASLPAVCVPPGARLLLQDIPEHIQRWLGVNVFEEVTFVQQSAEAYVYRDAVRFRNGLEILLQGLLCGQRVEVLSLGGTEERTYHSDDLAVHREMFMG